MAYIKMSAFATRQAITGNEIFVILADGRNAKVPLSVVRSYFGGGDAFGFRGNIVPSSAYPGLYGIYIPTQTGTYVNFGNIEVDLSEGLTVISSDQSGFVKIVVPIDLSGYLTADDLEEFTVNKGKRY